MNKEQIEFYIGKGGIAPTRNAGDAGYDFYVPKGYGGTSLKPSEGILINTEIRSKIPAGQALIAFNKSGIATKKHLQVGACVVDRSYQGEIHIHVFNWGTEEIYLESGDKLVQFVPICINENITHNFYEDELSVEEFYGEKSERGSGGFGSTGDKA